jgi:hypothetical protein
MKKDTAQQIEREFDRMCRTNHLFKEYVALHPDSSMDELLAGWAWVQKLMEKVIQRTIRDLTGPPPPPKLSLQRDR